MAPHHVRLRRACPALSGTLHASPGKRSLQANRNPVQAHGTPPKGRCCLYPRERLTVERPNSIQLARCNVSYQAFSHKQAKPAIRMGHSSPCLKAGAFWPQKGKQRILDEIAKCEVLCANCHRLLHWEERNSTDGTGALPAPGATVGD
jgi:hypothetical protein